MELAQLPKELGSGGTAFLLWQPCLHKAKAFRLDFQVGICECVALEDYENCSIMNEIFTEDTPLSQYVNISLLSQILPLLKTYTRKAMRTVLQATYMFKVDLLISDAREIV